MSVFELKLIIYLCLAASGLLSIIILLFPQEVPTTGAVLCLWGCGVLIGMSWQLIIDKKSQPQEKKL